MNSSKMRLSFSTGCTYCYPLAATFALVKEAGLGGVELVLGPETSWRGPRNVERLAARYDLTIYSIHPPILPFPGWSDLAINVRRLVEFASALDSSPLVILHPPKSQDIQQDDVGRRYLEALAACRDRFPEVAACIAVETPDVFRPQSRESEFANPEALRALAEREGLGLVLDTSHVSALPYDLLGAYELFRERLVNIHLSDLRRVPRLLDRDALHSYIRDHQLPGHGRLPLQSLIQALTRDDYHGLLTMELSPWALRIWSPRRVKQHLRQSISFVMQAVQRVKGEQEERREPTRAREVLLVPPI